MNRRDFLKYLLSTPLAATVDYEKLLWVPEKKIFTPTLKDISLYGVPYHMCDATTGTWMGIERSEVAQFSSKLPTESGYPLMIERVRKVLEIAVEANRKELDRQVFK